MRLKHIVFSFKIYTSAKEDHFLQYLYIVYSYKVLVSVSCRWAMYSNRNVIGMCCVCEIFKEVETYFRGMGQMEVSRNRVSLLWLVQKLTPRVIS